MKESPMPNLAPKSGKADRIEVRVSPHVKALLTAAAQARHTTVSDFLLNHGIAAAEQAIATPRVVYASESGWAGIHKLLDEDATPDPAVIDWLTKDRAPD